MFFRSKPVGSYRYLQIVHSVREGKKVRQQVIATLGRLDLLEASGQLERLMRSGLRHCESFAVIDAHAAGELEPVAIRRIGPDLVFARLWKESGIPEVLRRLLKARHYEFDVERAIYLTVLHRLFPSGSDLLAERWRGDYFIPGTEGLELHHLYQAMAFLGDTIEQVEKPIGAVRCTKDLRIAAKASVKSPVEIPFRYSAGINASTLGVRRIKRGKIALENRPSSRCRTRG